MMTRAPTAHSLGIDVGTSMAKAVVFDDRGTAVAVGARRLELHHPGPGRVEQDVDQVIAAVAGATRQALSDAGAEPRIVGITAQGDGCWLIDERARPVRPAISWMDARAAGIVDGWRQDGTAARVFRETGSALFAGSQGAILRWLREHEPQHLDRATTAAYCKDVVLQRMSGVRACDPSDASMPFRAIAGAPGPDYSPSVLEALDVTACRHLLAPVARPLPHGVATASADRFGVAVGTPVFAGPYDLPAAIVGAGLESAGDGVLTIGTTLACQVLVTPPRAHGGDDRNGAGLLLDLPRPGLSVRAMPPMVGTACLDWVLGVIGARHADLDDLLAASEPGARGVRALPYLAPSGERAPFVDPAAVGQFIGIRLTTTPADLVRALCEALAHAARQCFEAAGLSGRLVVCGGGSASAEWLQIFADVLQRPLSMAGQPEVGARGAVLAALDAAGDAVDAAAWTRTRRSLEPDGRAAGRSDRAYAIFLADQRNARQARAGCE